MGEGWHCMGKEFYTSMKKGMRTISWRQVLSYITIISAVRRIEFFSDRMSYIILKGCCCNILILSVHDLSEDKSEDIKDSFCGELGCVFDQFPSNNMTIFFGNFNAQVGREDIFKLTIGNKSSYEISNDNGFRVVNFATSRNLFIKSTMFPYSCIHKHTWTCPEGKTRLIMF
jgi:hypothetical protein